MQTSIADHTQPKGNRATIPITVKFGGIYALPGLGLRDIKTDEVAVVHVPSDPETVWKEEWRPLVVDAATNLLDAAVQGEWKWEVPHWGQGAVATMSAYTITFYSKSRRKYMRALGVGSTIHKQRETVRQAFGADTITHAVVHFQLSRPRTHAGGGGAAGSLSDVIATSL